MKHKTILSLNLICMILCCCVLSACKNNNTPNNNIPFVYTASTLMYDGCEILDFYSTDYSIIKNEDNSTIDASDCLYDSGNEDCSSLISKCYEFWTYCANGGYSYTDTNGNITNTYAIEFNGRQCTVKHTYQNNDLNPTSSAYRIIRNYSVISEILTGRCSARDFFAARPMRTIPPTWTIRRPSIAPIIGRTEVCESRATGV